MTPEMPGKLQPNENNETVILRKKAEEMAAVRRHRAKALAPGKIGELVHELDVHQIELELQNEELRFAQQELQRSRDRFADLFEFAPVGYLTLDAKLIILEANLSATRILDIERSRLIGKRLATFVSPKHIQPFRLCFQAAETKPRTSCELEMHRNKGPAFFAELKVSIVSNSSTEAHYRVALNDITERKEADNRIYELNRSLRRQTIELQVANKELEGYNFTICNNINAPLRHLDGFSQALLEEYADRLDERGKTYVTRISHASRLMSQFLEKLTELSSVTLVELISDTVNLSELAQAAAARLKLANPQRKITFQIQPGISASGDSRLLQIVIDNLFDNALKFTRDVPVSTVEFGITESKGKQAFFLRDNGTGFNMAYADNLFAPFVRLHSDDLYPGLGIGLAITRKIISRHGGDIWAESEPGKGATFYFTLSE